MLNKVLRIGRLYDFYGSLLTDKQQECLEMHYLNDLSLSEIADEFGVSRQAVHDILRRAEQTLEEYESKLGLVERHQRQHGMIQQAYDSIIALPHDIRQVPEVIDAVKILKRLLNYEEEGRDGF